MRISNIRTLLALVARPVFRFWDGPTVDKCLPSQMPEFSRPSLSTCAAFFLEIRHHWPSPIMCAAVVKGCNNRHAQTRVHRDYPLPREAQKATTQCSRHVSSSSRVFRIPLGSGPRGNRLKAAASFATGIGGGSYIVVIVA